MAVVQTSKANYGSSGVVSQPDFGENRSSDTLVKLAAATGAASPGFAGYLAKGVEAGVGGLMETATKERDKELAYKYEMKRQAAMKSLELMEKEWDLEHGTDEATIYAKKREADIGLAEAQGGIRAREKLDEKKLKGLQEGTKSRFTLTAKKNPDKVQYVISAAEKAGVDPAVALAVWGQESDFNTDPTFQSKSKTKYGYAKTPFQIMDELHPEIKEAKTFEQQADVFVKILARDGVRGYFGEGVDVNGMDTDTYEAMVAARAQTLLGTLAGFNYNEKGGFGITAKGEDTTYAAVPDATTTQLAPQPEVAVTDNLSPRQRRAEEAGLGAPQTQAEAEKPASGIDYTNIKTDSSFHLDGDNPNSGKMIARSGKGGGAIRLNGEWLTKSMWITRGAAEARAQDLKNGKKPLSNSEYIKQAENAFNETYRKLADLQGTTKLPVK